MQIWGFRTRVSAPLVLNFNVFLSPQRAARLTLAPLHVVICGSRCYSDNVWPFTRPVSARSEEVSTEIDTNCVDCTLLAGGAPAGTWRTCLSQPN